MPEAGPGPLLRLRDQTTLDRIAMDIADHRRTGPLSVDIAVVVAVLPELLARPSQPARSHLLDDLEKLRQQNSRRLIDEQVNMFRHQNVGVNPRLMPRTRLFQHRLERLAGGGRFKERETMKTTEGDEVQRPRILKPLQAARHGAFRSDTILSQRGLGLMVSHSSTMKPWMSGAQWVLGYFMTGPPAPEELVTSSGMLVDFADDLEPGLGIEFLQFQIVRQNPNAIDSVPPL